MYLSKQRYKKRVLLSKSQKTQNTQMLTLSERSKIDGTIIRKVMIISYLK